MQQLKYLFTATFKDGTKYVQNEEDRSLTEEGRSCYTDVRKQIEAGNDVTNFELKGIKHTYSVNLTTGEFSVDGLPFLMHEENLSDYRLIYFRAHTHTFSLTDQGYADKELSHDTVFRFGWQTTKDGENYQRVMQIS